MPYFWAVFILYTWVWSFGHVDDDGDNGGGGGGGGGTGMMNVIMDHDDKISRWP